MFGRYAIVTVDHGQACMVDTTNDPMDARRAVERRAREYWGRDWRARRDRSSILPRYVGDTYAVEVRQRQG